MPRGEGASGRRIATVLRGVGASERKKRQRGDGEEYRNGATELRRIGEKESTTNGGDMEKKKFVRTHFELEIFQLSFEAAMRIFEISKKFPKEETYSLTDQIRRASRSVSTNISESWRKRRYEAAFVSKLSDAETEAAETQTWLAFASACMYLSNEEAAEIRDLYEKIIPKIVTMINNPKPWLV